MIRFLSLLLTGLLGLAMLRPAAAQIIETENPATGERIYMSETLRRAEHKIMVRAIGRVGDTRRQWALTFRSTDASDDVQLMAEDEPLTPERISTDAETPGGMTTLFLSGETFYTVAHAETVTLTIGDKTLTLPAQIQDDMQRILNRAASGS